MQNTIARKCQQVSRFHHHATGKEQAQEICNCCISTLTLYNCRVITNTYLSDIFPGRQTINKSTFTRECSPGAWHDHVSKKHHYSSNQFGLNKRQDTKRVNLDAHSSTIVALSVFQILWGSERLISPSVADIGHQQRSKPIPHSESIPPRSDLPSCGEGSGLHDSFCLLWAGAYRIQDALPILSLNPPTPTFVRAWLPHSIVPVSFDATI